MCAEPIPSASRLLSSDDDNCSLSIAYKRHIFPRRDAFDTPAFITSERLARAQRGLAEHTSLIRVKRNARAFVWFGRALCWQEQMHRERRSETGKKPNGKLWSGGLAKAIRLNIIRKKRVSPELMPPSVHLWHVDLCPLTRGCTSERFTQLVVAPTSAYINMLHNRKLTWNWLHFFMWHYLFKRQQIYWSCKKGTAFSPNRLRQWAFLSLCSSVLMFSRTDYTSSVTALSTVPIQRPHRAKCSPNDEKCSFFLFYRDFKT